ncbi:MAG: alpha/beta hydrolase [Planctomycetota bacterium]
MVVRAALILCWAFALSGCASLDGEQRTTASDGVELVYDVSGEGETTLVFVHGWLCDRTHWESQVVHFQGDYRVVTMDLGGHGESTKNVAQRPQWSLPRLAEDVRSVLHDVERRSELGRFVIVGHSLGGPVSAMAATDLPGELRGVVGVDTFHDASVEFTPEMIDGMAGRFADDFHGAVDRMVAGSFAPPADEVAVERVQSIARRVNPRIGVAILRSYVGVSLGEVLRRCPVPVFCINADRQKTELSTNRRYAPNFEVAVLSDVGHFLMIEKPYEFHRYLEAAIDRLLTDDE